MTTSEERQTLLVAFLGAFRSFRSLPIEVSIDAPQQLSQVIESFCVSFGPAFRAKLSAPGTQVIVNNRPVEFLNPGDAVINPGDELVFAADLGWTRPIATIGGVASNL